MLHTSVTYRIWSFMPLLLLLHASQVGGCTQIIRGKGQNFLCFQEAVMQAVHVLNTVTVPMGLQCPGLILISPENTQDECWWFFLCNSHVTLFFSLFISGRMVGKANHCFTTSMGYTFCSMCLHCPNQSGKEAHRSNFQPFETQTWNQLKLCCPTCGGV